MNIPASQPVENNSQSSQRNASKVVESVSFGRFEFGEESKVNGTRNKGATDTLGLLKHVEAKQEKLKKLKQKDSEKVKKKKKVILSRLHFDPFILLYLMYIYFLLFNLFNFDIIRQVKLKKT